MFNKAIEAFLPGLRDLRVPLVGGLLWTLFGWLLVADRIPNASSAGGTWKNVLDLSNSLGRSGTIAVAVTLIYLLGVMMQGPSGALATALGKPVRVTANRVRWHRRVNSARRESRALIERSTNALSSDELSPAQRNRLQHRIDTAEKRLVALTSKRRWLIFKYVRKSTEALKIVPANDQDTQRRNLVVRQAYKRGAEQEIVRHGVRASIRDLGGPEFEHFENLAIEMADDALDVMRALDESYYQTLDRERSERELRIGVSVPLMAIGVDIGLTLSPWGWLLVCVSLSALLRSSLGGSDERERVLAFVSLRGLTTASLRDAENDGRDAVRAFLTT